MSPRCPLAGAEHFPFGQHPPSSPRCEYPHRKCLLYLRRAGTPYVVTTALGMLAIALRLAEDFLRQAGTVCVQQERPAAADQHTRITVRSVEVRDWNGLRLWFNTRRKADAVLAELIADCRQASKINGAILVTAPISQVDRMLRAIAQRCDYTVADDLLVAVTIARLERGIQDAIDSMQRAGQLKRLNREYRDLRTKGAKPLPLYSEWLVSRLKTEVSQCANSVNFTRLCN